MVPTQIVMQRVVSGKAWPSSVEELCGMIVEQALVSGVITTVTDKVHADLVRTRAERAAARGAEPAAAPSALLPRRSQEPSTWGVSRRRRRPSLPFRRRCGLAKDKRSLSPA